MELGRNRRGSWRKRRMGEEKMGIRRWLFSSISLD
jgi:hypothetical protein